jgi:5-oxoprolinase (ATP-hydrolysing) subunit A
VPGEPRTVDLNADVGEAEDAAGIAVERELLALVTSAHVACGGHAGDDESMRATVQAALAHGVRVGAHPSYPDREGFGRRDMDMAAADLASTLRAQIGALSEVARTCGTRVQSVKPHGALYAEVGRGGDACAVLLGVMGDLCGDDVAVVLPSGAPALAVIAGTGRPALREGFADRAYAADGGLVSRHRPGAVLSDVHSAGVQALGLVEDGTVRADDGTMLSLAVDTICVHGDSPNAAAIAEAVRVALAGAGVVVSAPAARHG